MTDNSVSVYLVVASAKKKSFKTATCGQYYEHLRGVKHQHKQLWLLLACFHAVFDLAYSLTTVNYDRKMFTSLVDGQNSKFSAFFFSVKL
jgi:hypothetical protein